MTWDPVSERVLLHAGTEDSAAGFAGELGDTWAWNGASWASIHNNGQLSQAGLALAFDGTSVIRVDGLTTRRWLGNAWGSPLSNGAFPGTARSDFLLAPSPNAGKLTLFGGAQGTGTPPPLVQQTVEWDPTANPGWTVRTPNPVGTPTARRNVAAAFDPQRNTVAGFSGACSASGLACTAVVNEWSGSAWSARTVTGTAPSGRGGAAAAYLRAWERLVVVGGQDNSGGIKGDSYTLADPAARRPGALFAFDFATAGFSAAQVRGLTIRGAAGGDAGGVAGADVAAWSDGQRAWEPIAATTTTAAGAFTGAADPAPAFVSADQQIHVRVQSAGAQGASEAVPAASVVDVLEIAVRYER
jgi:hypothetical protein